MLSSASDRQKNPLNKRRSAPQTQTMSVFSWVVRASESRKTQRETTLKLMMTRRDNPCSRFMTPLRALLTSVRPVRDRRLSSITRGNDQSLSGSETSHLGGLTYYLLTREQTEISQFKSYVIYDFTSKHLLTSNQLIY